MSEDNEPIMLTVFDENEYGIYNNIVINKPWLTALPQLGHIIQFKHEGELILAKIEDITWDLGDTESDWMGGKTINITATTNF